MLPQAVHEQAIDPDPGTTISSSLGEMSLPNPLYLTAVLEIAKSEQVCAAYLRR
jgi:hypothetical protein